VKADSVPTVVFFEGLSPEVVRHVGEEIRSNVQEVAKLMEPLRQYEARHSPRALLRLAWKKFVEIFRLW